MGHPIDNKKAAFYGQFVQAAYAMYKNAGPDDLKPAPSGIPEGWELGAYVHMSDFIGNTEVPRFYGIVVHSLEDPNSRTLAIRGTEGAIEWLDDAAAIPVPFRQVPSAGRVAGGFDKIYASLKVVKHQLAGTMAPAGAASPEPLKGSFVEQLEQLAISREVERGFAAPSKEARSRPQRPTVVTGHSLGSALATLFVMENDDKRKFDLSTLCTFASPRVGDTEFVHRFNQLPIDSWRIVNTQDVVPKLPFRIPFLLDYGHVDAETTFDSSKFGKNNAVCWHSMDTYLHSLDSSHPLLPECVK
jgi:hypothetical protein